MATLTHEPTIGQLVAERASRAKVFERFGIDYCCGGKVSVAEACARKGIDPVAVIAALEALDAALGVTPAERDWTTAPLDVLATHILDTHHAYLRGALPRMAFLTAKVARVHGDTHPELIEVARIYEKFHADLAQHMLKEENVLFPAIIARAQGRDPGFAPPIQFPIGVMEQEHDEAGRELEAMSRLTNGYAVPPEACNSYRAMLDGLQELERDTHLHIHLENNILFPRALAAVGIGG